MTFSNYKLTEMKLSRIITMMSGGAITLSLLLLSCEKETGKETAIESMDLSNSAIIQVFNASVPSAATDPRRNYVYVDNVPLTGAPIAFGSFFPSSSTGSAVVSGARQFLIKDTIRTSLQPQLEFPQTLTPKSSY